LEEALKAGELKSVSTPVALALSPDPDQRKP
jgi:hypothetical protein